jgi:hypothetical protein
VPLWELAGPDCWFSLPSLPILLTNIAGCHPGRAHMVAVDERVRVGIGTAPLRGDLVSGEGRKRWS